MATVHYYVDTASTAGGDGTTTATTGANRAFSSAQAALTALKQNLVTAGNILVIHHAASGAAKDPNVGFDLDYTGWTTSSTCYLVQQVDTANRHAGIYDTTKYRMEGNFGAIWSAVPQYTRVIGMQGLNTSDDLGLMIFKANGLPSQGAQFLNNIGRFKDQNFTYGTLYFVSFNVDNTGDPVIVANNLFYGGVGTHGHVGSQGINGANTKAVVYNNTFIGFGAASDASSVFCPDGYSKITCINNLVTGYSSFGSPNGTGTDYNATDLAAASGKTHDRVSQTFTFVDSVGTPKKYQLASGDAGAKGFGKDLSSDATFPITTDIAGTTRTTPWDIGAFIAAASSLVSASGAISDGVTDSGTGVSLDIGSGAVSAGVTGTGTGVPLDIGSGGVSDGATTTGTIVQKDVGSGAISDGATASGAGAPLDLSAGSISDGASGSGSGTIIDPASGGISDGATGSGTVQQTNSASGGIADGATVSGAVQQKDVASGGIADGATVSGTTAPFTPASGGIADGATASGTGTMVDAASGGIADGATTSGAGAVVDPASGGMADGATGSGTVQQTDRAAGGISGAATGSGVGAGGLIATGGISDGVGATGAVSLPTNPAAGGIGAGAKGTGNVVSSESASGAINTGDSATGTVDQTTVASGSGSAGATATGGIASGKAVNYLATLYLASKYSAELTLAPPYECTLVLEPG